MAWFGPTHQTSLSESGQSKALIVLDAETWEEKAVIPLDIGRRFFRVKGEHEPLPIFGEVRWGVGMIYSSGQPGLIAKGGRISLCSVSFWRAVEV